MPDGVTRKLTIIQYDKVRDEAGMWTLIPPWLMKQINETGATVGDQIEVTVRKLEKEKPRVLNIPIGNPEGMQVWSTHPERVIAADGIPVRRMPHPRSRQDSKPDSSETERGS